MWQFRLSIIASLEQHFPHLSSLRGHWTDECVGSRGWQNGQIEICDLVTIPRRNCLLSLEVPTSNTCSVLVSLNHGSTWKSSEELFKSLPAPTSFIRIYRTQSPVFWKTFHETIGCNQSWRLFPLSRWFIWQYFQIHTICKCVSNFLLTFNCLVP